MPFDIDTIQVIDTREHMADAYAAQRGRTGLLELLSVDRGLMAAVRMVDPNAETRGDPPGAKELQAILRKLPELILTSGWKHRWIAFHDLYDLNDPTITEDNWEELDGKIREAYGERAAWHEEILRRAGIRLFLWCYGAPPVHGGCRGVLRIGDFLKLPAEAPSSPDELAGRLHGWMDMELQRYNPAAVSLDGSDGLLPAFSRPDEKTIEGELAAWKGEQTPGSSRTVGRFLLEEAVAKAARAALPVQIELPEENDGKRRLRSFIRRNPEALFDVSISGFSGGETAVNLCRAHSNAYLNLCGLGATAETRAQSLLETALEALPVNKLLWGGDADTPEAAYGALTLFRTILDRALCIKEIPDKPREEIAERIFWKNADRLYHLS